ncbi:preprotein translocase subunit YajC [Merdimmobilis hominis]|jgi:preprotein translocase subunit YajC|uniref:Preprotein translocase subunit YajC n=1 Tax=uncultured Anaerotruncus sp. TaxID=905011 RepID=A0A6N2SAC4_9FIRM
MTQIMLQTPTNASMAMFTQFAMIAAMFAILYFFMIRPQKKKEKEIQLMRSKLEVGDEIVTIGGIIGRVVNIKDETIVIETGSDRSKIRITRWAVQQNNSAK